MTRYLGILGYPLAHSISPVMQQAALNHHSLDVRYEAWPTPPEELSERVDGLRDERYLGANVTIPHKERARRLVDRCDAWSSQVGAVNTIVKDDGHLVGHNTDSEGFLRALQDRGGFDLDGAHVLLLGAGGAARAAAFGLAGERIASLTIVNRTQERAQALADEVRPNTASAASVSMDSADLERAARGASLIVNATSMGMSHSTAEGLSPLPAGHIQSGATVFDMVYAPAETPLLAEARRAGATGLGGLWMLVYQGAAGFELWTDKPAPVDAMYRAAETALAETAA